MNAFAQFGLEPALEIDAQVLNERFERLRTEFHPDRFSQGGALERRLAVQRAADINAAHAVLIDPLARVQLLFEMRGIAPDGTRSVQDNAFLMQQMELREALDEAHDAASRDKLRDKLDGLWNAAWARLSEALHDADAGIAWRELHRLQFLRRLLEQMN